MPSGREQDRAFQAELLAQGLILRAHLCGVVEGDEFVGGDIDVGGGGLHGVEFIKSLICQHYKPGGE